MNVPLPQTAANDLVTRWARLRQEEPRLRQRNAAEKLGVSEAELVAAHVGSTATRLDTRWVELLIGLEAVGPVTGLTRNEDALIEVTGTFRNVDIGGMMGVVLDEGLDLRVFLRAWHVGFALLEQTGKGLRRSIQVFDQAGVAVHKLFLRDESNAEAFDALTARHKAEDQGTAQALGTVPEKPEEKPDAEIDAAALRASWDGLQDTHDFFGMLRKHGATRTQAFRLADPKWVTPISPKAYRDVLAQAAKDGLEIMVFVGNHGMIQIKTGTVKRVQEVGTWFNVLDPDFNLHLNEPAIVKTWAIRKPTRDGVVTSVECYDAQGELVVQFFGKRKPGIPELESWRELVRALPTAEGHASA